MEFEKLKEIIADVLNVNADEITEDTTFVDDLGADSLDIFQIIMGIEETYDIETMKRPRRSLRLGMPWSRSRMQRIISVGIGMLEKARQGFFIF